MFCGCNLQIVFIEEPFSPRTKLGTKLYVDLSDNCCAVLYYGSAYHTVLSFDECPFKPGTSS